MPPIFFLERIPTFGRHDPACSGSLKCKCLGKICFYSNTGTVIMGCWMLETTSHTYSTYVCIIIINSRVWTNRVRLPILLVVSWTGKTIFSLFPFAPKIFGLARKVWPSRLASVYLFPTLRLNLVLTRGIPLSFRDGVLLLIYTVIRHRVSPDVIRSCNCVPMTFTSK